MYKDPVTTIGELLLPEFDRARQEGFSVTEATVRAMAKLRASVGEDAYQKIMDAAISSAGTR